MKKTYFRHLTVLLLIGAVLLLMYRGIFSRPTEKEPGQYSVILYQNADGDWTALLEGIRQAEKDDSAVVNYVTMPLDSSPENELELIRREVDNGAEGILLAPIDSESLQGDVEAISKDVPILTLETGLGTRDADISGDNYAMGHLLGTHVASDMEKNGEKTVCVIKEYMQRQSVQQRCLGFTDAIKELIPDADIQTYSRSEGDYNLPLCIASMYVQGNTGIYLAALDKYCTEALIEASSTSLLDGDAQSLFRNRAFGIGNTEKTVSGLDTGSIRGLVYQNEFHMGYQGLQSLIAESRNKKPEQNTEVKYYYVTLETLYEPENQQLLFPLK